MHDEFDVEGAWPELFADLSYTQHESVRQSLAAGWHEGNVPTREDVENLTDYARGAIDFAEYQRRARAAALRGVGALSSGR
ncbi:antitoxin VbhA family protein [Corynebacterium ulceribovis]|uniref:antitoxin VbhA family protein n=1 Tax=Corynebacterium ulceribovis TaxID=487732 RepID=UPI000369C37A|nr:antitoxin VbhA family protein [Corynebacterium ulceribovis]